MKKIILSIFISICFPFFATYNWLLWNPSPSSASIGFSGVANYSDDIYSIFDNPAHGKLTDGLSLHYSNLNYPLIPSLSDDLNTKTNVKRIAYSNQSSKMNNIRFQYSFSHSSHRIKFGSTYNMTSIIAKNDFYNISFGVNFTNNPFYIIAGLSLKDIKTAGFCNYNTNNLCDDNFNLYDIGFRLGIENPKIDKLKFMTINLSFAYSAMNISREFNYLDYPMWYNPNNDVLEPIPYPRLAKLGLMLGLKITPLKNNRDLGITLTFNRQANNRLITHLQDYDNTLFGDIRFKKHLLSGDSDHNVYINEGLELSFFDIFYIRKGKFSDPPLTGRDIFDNKGYSINYTNFCDLILSLIINNLSNDFDNEIFVLSKRIFDFIDISYNYSDYDDNYLLIKDNEETRYSLIFTL